MLRRIRILRYLTIVLLLLLCLSARADQELVQRVLNGEDIRLTCTLAFQRETPEEAAAKTITLTAPMNGSEKARVVFEFAVSGELSQSDSAELTWQLGALVGESVPSLSGVDARTAANAIAGSFEQRRVASDGESAVYARENLYLTRLTVSIPWYPSMKPGDKGEEVQKLQQRLITLGYLDGEADGQYGKQTAQAVREAQEALRGIQKRNMAERMPAQSDGVVSADIGIETAQAEPTLANDGAADSLTVMLLYSDAPAENTAIDSGSPKAEVTRLQRRLLALGCLTGKADGDYGSMTRLGVRIFQHYNGLPETGAADEATLRLIFSNSAAAPDYELLREGSSGEAVKNLQRRLRRGGFYTGPVDGGYGASTVEGVKNLQSYLRARQSSGFADGAEYEQDAAGFPEEEGAAAVIEVNGVADPMLLDAFYANDFPIVPEDVMKVGATGEEVVRLQRRLKTLEYMYSSPDGDFGEGTKGAIRKFQMRNNLTADGTAGRSTLAALFSLDAKQALKPYLLRVSTAKQRVYAYAPDDQENYTVLVRTMKCSTGRAGSPTPKGTYKASTGPGARWHYFKKFGCWAQYAYSIQGDILFHSVLYGSRGGAVTRSSVYNLGRRASHGCVRLSVEDAKWVWENCPRNTTVIVE